MNPYHGSLATAGNGRPPCVAAVVVTMFISLAAIGEQAAAGGASGHFFFRPSEMIPLRLHL